MRLPFTIEQFFAVFAAYNAAIWPAQIAAYGLGLAVVGMLLWDSMIGKRLILFILIAGPGNLDRTISGISA